MTVSINSYDDELRARPIQGNGGLQHLSLAPIQPAPKGISGVSSIEEMDEGPSTPIHRPILEAPSTHYMYAVLKAQAGMEKSTSRSSELFDLQIKKDLAERDRLSLEKEESLKKAAEAAATRDTWDTLSSIGQYLAGAGAIALGTALSGIPGFLLAAGGVAGIGNRVIHDTNLLQAAVAWYTKSEELQKTLTQRIEMGLFFLQMGLGLAGGYSAWTTGAFAATNPSILDVSQKISGVISGASSAMSVSGRAGKSMYEKQVSNHTAQATELNAQLTAQSHQITEDVGRMTRRLEEDEQIVDELHKAVEKSQITLD